MTPTPCAQVPVHPRYGRLWGDVKAAGSELSRPNYLLDDLFDQDAIDSVVAAERERLDGIVKLAAQFTKANDSGDDISDKLDGASPEEVDAILAANELSDDDYNRTKDALFIACRALMGWPARRANYSTLGPTPSAQIDGLAP